MSKFVAFSWTSFKNTQVYKLDVLLRLLTSLLAAVAIRELWIALYRSDAGLYADTGVSLDAMTTYAVLSIIVRSLLAPDLAQEVEQRVRTGDIVLDLLKPWNFMAMLLSKSVGQSLYSLLYLAVPLFAAAALLFPFERPASAAQWLGFAVSLLLAFLVSYAINFIVSLFAFFFVSSWGFEFVKLVMIELASGSIVPLWFFSEQLQTVIRWLPFQAMYSIPLSIFIGRVEGAELWGQLALQLGWAIALFAAGAIAYRFVQRLLLTSGG